MTWEEESILKEQVQDVLGSSSQGDDELILSQDEGDLPFLGNLSFDYQERNQIEDLYQEISDGGGRSNLRNQGFWREKFEYDPSGNVVSKQNGWGQINYEYNESNQLTQAGNRSYQYDKNGNLIREDLDGLYAQYEYNYENRLTSVKNNRVPHFHGGGTPFFGEIEYQYDALNRKVTKDIEAFSGIKKEVEHYIYDGLGVDILAEYRLEAIRDDHPGQGQKTGNPFVTGRLQRINEYYYGNGSLVAMHNNERPDQGNAWGRNRREPLRDVYFYHQDRLNSVRKTTGRNGEVVERYNYDAYGYPYQGRFEQNHRRSNPFGFTGKRHEVELGIHSFAYRHYNPRSMRWLTVDPIQDGLNWYQYVGGDPVNYVDPLGLQLLKAGEIREAAGMLDNTDSTACGEDESEVISSISQYDPTQDGISGPVSNVLTVKDIGEKMRTGDFSDGNIMSGMKSSAQLGAALEVADYAVRGKDWESPEFIADVTYSAVRSGVSGLVVGGSTVAGTVAKQPHFGVLGGLFIDRRITNFEERYETKERFRNLVVNISDGGSHGGQTSIKPNPYLGGNRKPSGKYGKAGSGYAQYYSSN
ncbi:RHS repeat domain-containing protein [Natroniella sp. ANB-PHB2]|uniref:RHS repeat domain-containing protein n=1 Tax=Natroniella sp. ANB-PHB2 TaxID=3384444 RepID=UPI0038D4136D